LTFGYTTKGASSGRRGSNGATGAFATLSEPGNGVSISQYIKGDTSKTDYVNFGLYTDGNSSNLITNGGTSALTVSPGFDGIKTSNFGTTPQLTAGAYRIVFANSEGYEYFYYDTGSAGSFYFQDCTFSLFPKATINWDPYHAATNKYSIYVTYSTGSPITSPNLKPRIDGALKSYSDGWVRVDGALKKIDSIWARVDGALKKL
jgi:hypothetical protein